VYAEVGIIVCVETLKWRNTGRCSDGCTCVGILCGNECGDCCAVYVGTSKGAAWRVVLMVVCVWILCVDRSSDSCVCV